MNPFLRNLTGLDNATTKELLTFLLQNLGSKVAGTLALVMGTLYWIAPELPDRWESFCRRGVIACGVYLLVMIAWRQTRNQKMLAKTIAVAAKADATVLGLSAAADPSVKRELKKIDVAASGSQHAPPGAR